MNKEKEKRIVVYDNNYMEALYQTDYLAKKIMIAASLRCGDMDWKSEGCEITMSSSELRELSGLPRNSLKHLEHAIKKLTETSVTVRNPKNPKHWIIFNYLPRGEYENGTLSLLINSEMKPFIQDLQKNFTQYHIENIKPLKSGYSIRIFELLKMSTYKGKYRVKVNELRKMFGLTKKYENYNDLKKRIIEPAKRELKEYCEIYFEYKEIKTGNKVTEIEFEIFKQRKEFSLPEEVIEANVKDIEFKEVIHEKTGLEIELNKLGWNGEFEELLREVSKEAVGYYLSPLSLMLQGINRSQTSPEKLHRYIDSLLKTHAEQAYTLTSKKTASQHQENVKKTEQIHSELGKKLIKLGFIGEVEKYIKEEGRGVIEEALKNIESRSNIKNAGGLLRERVKALKEQKTLLEEEKTETTQKAEKELQNKIEKYLARAGSFSEDYKRFMDIHLLEEDRTVLQKYIGKEIGELPRNVLNGFLQWIS